MSGTVIEINGEAQTIFTIEDFMPLLESNMGYSSRRWLEDYLSDRESDWAEYDDLETEYEDERSREKEVMKRLRTLSEQLAGEIVKKDLDRRDISNLAGEIGIITGQEVNRC